MQKWRNCLNDPNQYITRICGHKILPGLSWNQYFFYEKAWMDENKTGVSGKCQQLVASFGCSKTYILRIYSRAQCLCRPFPLRRSWPSSKGTIPLAHKQETVFSSSHSIFFPYITDAFSAVEKMRAAPSWLDLQVGWWHLYLFPSMRRILLTHDYSNYRMW